MRTDRHDAANFAFRNFANVPNMEPQNKNYTISYIVNVVSHIGR